MTIFEKSKIMNGADLSSGEEQYKIPIKQSIMKYTAPDPFKYLAHGYEYDKNDPEVLKLLNKVWPACNCRNSCEHGHCACTKSAQPSFMKSDHDSVRNDAFNPFYVGMMIRECTSRCRCLPIVCKNRMLSFFNNDRVWQMQKKVSVFKTKYCGWGLRAEEFCDVGDFIGPYIGKLIDPRYVDDDFRDKADYCMNIIGSPLVIDAQAQGNALRFANHHCDPNMDQVQVVIEGHIPLVCFYANQRIYPGEELTFNYGDQYWKTVKDSNPNISCRCGSKHCPY